MTDNKKGSIIGAFSILMLLLCTIAIVACGGGGGGEEEIKTDMLEPRGLHTATLLPDGKLIVVGGRAGAAAAAKRGIENAEIYDNSYVPDPDSDASTGPWASAGAMQDSRYDHTATLLQNGSILITGGDEQPGGAFGYYASTVASRISAELYDPSTGSWSKTPDMLREHGLGHTSTLLSDGKVLVTGGLWTEASDRPRVPSEFAELYDPASGTWEPTGNMTEGRSKHKAFLLENGNVLVIGGSSAELYDPSKGTWSKAGNLPSDHGGQFSATTLQDGRILVAGGGHSRWVEGVEVSPPTPINNTDIYDPSTGEWSSASNMYAPELGHTGTLLPDGKVLTVGPLSAQLYDPASDTWSSAGDMSTQRGSPMVGGPAGAFHTATLMPDGKVIIVGGNALGLTKYGAEDTREGISSIQIYDPGTGWE